MDCTGTFGSVGGGVEPHDGHSGAPRPGMPTVLPSTVAVRLWSSVLMKSCCVFLMATSFFCWKPNRKRQQGGKDMRNSETVDETA